MTNELTEANAPLAVADTFKIEILGRILQHLGVQMYSNRDTALAELVSNSWDAGAQNVWITLPDTATYSPTNDVIIVSDDGSGMTKEEVQEGYLIIGRNRRVEDGGIVNGRYVMGRKGIGKLAGFGMANKVQIETWKQNEGVEFVMNVESLESSDNKFHEVKIPYDLFSPADHSLHGASGTRITLVGLKHETPLEPDSLHRSLARRFSRSVQGHMKIWIDGQELKPFDLDLHKTSPPLSSIGCIDKLPSGSEVTYNYIVTDKPIKHAELRGFTIIVRGKTAQAPNFFFDADSKAGNQHSSKYLSGTIEADFLDTGTDDDSDVIATDRQQINWEKPMTKELWIWGYELCKNLFAEIAERNADEVAQFLSEDPDLSSRIALLDRNSRGQVQKILNVLQNNIDKEKKPQARTLADQVVRAYEYQHFVDITQEIEQIAAEKPEDLAFVLTKMADWKVMESRAILEIINGRIAIVDTFHRMISNDAPETSNRTIGDNMHDLIAAYPWLLNPQWQVMVEEKTVSDLIKTWLDSDVPVEKDQQRIDFLALDGEGEQYIIEIKRAGRTLEFGDFQRLQGYINKLNRSRTDGKKLIGVVLYGGHAEFEIKDYQSKNTLFFTWSDIYKECKLYYEHYRAVLKGEVDSPAFFAKTREVITFKGHQEKAMIRRTPEDRKAGVGPQDINYEASQDSGGPIGIPIVTNTRPSDPE